MQRLVKLVAVLFLIETVFIASSWSIASFSIPKWNGRCEAGTHLVVLYGGRTSLTRTRVKAAQSALQDCEALSAFLIGGARPKTNFFGAEEMKSELIANGIDANRLISENQSNDSLSNATALVAMMAGKKHGNLVLVSDSLHIFRMLYATALTDRIGKQHRISSMAVQPEPYFTTLIWRPHYEAIAWAFLVLPEDARSWILSKIRI